jgi:hypothetical protein
VGTIALAFRALSIYILRTVCLSLEPPQMLEKRPMIENNGLYTMVYVTRFCDASSRSAGKSVKNSRF